MLKLPFADLIAGISAKLSLVLILMAKRWLDPGPVNLKLRLLLHNIVNFLFYQVHCKATCSLKQSCLIESNIENSASTLCSLRDLVLRALELNNIVLLQIKPFIASQRTLGSSAKPALKPINSVNPETNWLTKAAFFYNEILKRHLATHLEKRPKCSLTKPSEVKLQH